MRQSARLSPHFTYEEMIASQRGRRAGLYNIPGDRELENLQRLCTTVLEPLRYRLFNTPIFVSSGYRSPEINRLVGGSDGSAHCDGRAVDIVAPPLDIDRLFLIVAMSGLPIRQVIHEFGEWVHIEIELASLQPQAFPLVGHPVCLVATHNGERTSYWELTRRELLSFS